MRAHWCDIWTGFPAIDGEALVFRLFDDAPGDYDVPPAPGSILVGYYVEAGTTNLRRGVNQALPGELITELIDPDNLPDFTYVADDNIIEMIIQTKDPSKETIAIQKQKIRMQCHS